METGSSQGDDSIVIKKLKRGEAGGRTKRLDLRAKAVADRMERGYCA